MADQMKNYVEDGGWSSDYRQTGLRWYAEWEAARTQPRDRQVPEPADNPPISDAFLDDFLRESEFRPVNNPPENKVELPLDQCSAASVWSASLSRRCVIGGFVIAFIALVALALALRASADAAEAELAATAERIVVERDIESLLSENRQLQTSIAMSRDLDVIRRRSSVTPRNPQQRGPLTRRHSRGWRRSER